MQETEPRVYFRRGPLQAEIGPLWAWNLGDEVHIPRQPDRYGMKGMPAFDGVVERLDQDGIAFVGPLADDGE